MWWRLRRMRELVVDATLPVLGVGLGYRAPHFTDLFRCRSEVDFLEITADHFLGAPPEVQAELKLLAEHFTLIPHGLDLSLGSAEGLNEPYAEAFAAMVAELRPPWCSEHIAFTRAGGVEIGHLVPLPFTHEAVKVLVRNVARVQPQLCAPLILENITYSLRLPGAEMSEGEFLRRVCECTNCGWLLDVTNLFVNSRNHGFDPRRWLDEAPLERVVQLHFVGTERHGGEWVDGHSTPMDSDLWALLEEVMTRAPVRGAILERDQHLPALAELLPELRTAREIGRRCGRWG